MIEVIRSAIDTNRDAAEDNVAWALNTALEVVSNLNEEKEDGETLAANGDALFIASMLLSELKNTNS